MRAILARMGGIAWPGRRLEQQSLLAGADERPHCRQRQRQQRCEHAHHGHVARLGVIPRAGDDGIDQHAEAQQRQPTPPAAPAQQAEAAGNQRAAGDGFGCDVKQTAQRLGGKLWRLAGKQQHCPHGKQQPAYSEGIDGGPTTRAGGVHREAPLGGSPGP